MKPKSTLKSLPCLADIEREVVAESREWGRQRLQDRLQQMDASVSPVAFHGMFAIAGSPAAHSFSQYPAGNLAPVFHIAIHASWSMKPPHFSDAGCSRLPANVADRLAERLKREDLSAREMEVLELLVRGRSNKEIADVLGLTEAAVKFRLKGMFVKLDVRDPTEAVVPALRHGIVHLD